MNAYELTAGDQVRAISFNEPFGSLIVNNNKIETRRRQTNVRGWVLICTCRKPYTLGQIRSISGLEQTERIFNRISPGQYINGKAIGIGRLVECRQMSPPSVSNDENATFVKYRPDLWLWQFKDVFPLIPKPWNGSQGWTFVPDDYLKELFIKR